MLGQGGFECVFHRFDEDGDGKISANDLRRCLAVVGAEEGAQEEVEAIVKALDMDGDGMLDVEEFVGLMKEERAEEMREAFEKYLMDGSECITPRSLKRMLSRLGESRTVGECQHMISQFDLNRDGVICYNEFLVMMQ
ncbi:hypothetical protein Scep_017297 [Stephania cephalantha]|uniref:EF-hand domain-containing protein n=1 Tax=Stephania cephalantha TaxID=152367 RepID=A0AAP0IP70_9MAGN